MIKAIKKQLLQNEIDTLNDNLKRDQNTTVFIHALNDAIHYMKGNDLVGNAMIKRVICQLCILLPRGRYEINNFTIEVYTKNNVVLSRVIEK